MRIISRDEWGARPPKRTPTPIPLPTPELWLHHAAGAVLPDDDTLSLADLARIRSIQNYHMDGRGWNDIGYSFLLDPDGNVFEGRGVGIRGAHTENHNVAGHGICVMGHYDIQQPEPDLFDRLDEFVAYGHTQGWWPPKFTGGHRDVSTKTCPGKYLYPYLDGVDVKEVYARLQAVAVRAGYNLGTYTPYLPAGDPDALPGCDGVWGAKSRAAWDEIAKPVQLADLRAYVKRGEIVTIT